MNVPIMAMAAAVGAAYMAWVFRQMKRPFWWGLGLGALAGTLGSLLFMTPLDFCTFEPERKPMDNALGVLLVLAGVAIVSYPTGWLARYFLARGEDRKALRGEQVKGAFNAPFFVPLLLLAPTLVILALFLYYPALDLFRLSTLLTRLGTPRTAFRCVDNFSRLLDPNFTIVTLGLLIAALVILAVMWFLRRRGDVFRNDVYRTLSSVLPIVLLFLLLSATLDLFEAGYRSVVFSTFYIAGWTVSLGLVIGLAVAYLAFQPVKGASIYRTLLIWPYAVSPAIAGIIFFVMFDPVGGIINHVLGQLGLGQPQWLKDPWLARWTIIIASVWKTLGYNILFYIAGLQNIANDLLEAAAIDGANAWQRFYHVVLPGLSPITFFLVITNITYAFFELFGTVDFLTKGGPAGSTSIMIYEIYTRGIIEFDIGRAAAQSIILFIMVIGVTIFQFRTSGRSVSYGA